MQAKIAKAIDFNIIILFDFKINFDLMALTWILKVRVISIFCDFG